MAALIGLEGGGNDDIFSWRKTEAAGHLTCIYEGARQGHGLLRQQDFWSEVNIVLAFELKINRLLRRCQTGKKNNPLQLTGFFFKKMFLHLQMSSFRKGSSLAVKYRPEQAPAEGK